MRRAHRLERGGVASITAGLAVASLLVATTAPACLDFGDEPLLDFNKPCSTQEDCADYVPALAIFHDKACNPGSCNIAKGHCESTPRTGPLPDDVDGDCKRPVCTNGVRTTARDEFDVPAPSECRAETCDAFPVNRNGAPCSGGVCRGGACVAPEPESDAGAGDAAADAAEPADAADDAADGN